MLQFPQFIVSMPALAFPPFGLSSIVFWMYVSAAVVLIVGLFKIFGELGRLRGLDKVMPFGRLFFAIPLAVFGSEHFTVTAEVAKLVPGWIPGATLWVYLIGLGFICAAISIVLLIKARLAAALVGMTFLIFVLVMDLPATLTHPDNRFFWALALRQLAFSGGAFAFAMSAWSNQRGRGFKQEHAGRVRTQAIPRFFVGVPSIFYGVEHLLHPTFVPGIPLNKLTPEWIPGHIVLSFLVGAILILAGLCLVINKKTRLAATVLGLTILLAVLWIYLPMLIAAPRDVVALNFFFDTLFFSGTILLLANTRSD